MDAPKTLIQYVAHHTDSILSDMFNEGVPVRDYCIARLIELSVIENIEQLDQYENSNEIWSAYSSRKMAVLYFASMMMDMPKEQEKKLEYVKSIIQSIKDNKSIMKLVLLATVGKIMNMSQNGFVDYE